MAVDYEVICRQGDLGSLLTAAFLAKEKCRVLLLPPLSVKASEPNFLIPVVRGYPAKLLAALTELENPPAEFFSWQSGSEVRSWPDSVSREGELSEFAELNLSPKLWLELEQLWQLLDRCMAQGFEMPASSLGGLGRMLWLLVRNELVRERRHCTLTNWLEIAEIPLQEQHLWRSLIPLISLSRFADPPLLSFAYGVQTLLAPDAWVGISGLKTKLHEYLLSRGAHQENENWSPVFDGKWFIGVGNDAKVARRATVFLADSEPRSLINEVPSGYQRRDFKRQFQLDDPGYIHLQTVSNQIQRSTGQALYHLDCRETDDFSGSTILGPECESGQGLIEHRWQAAADGKDQEKGYTWGWRPRLPAMMGGGFLPLIGSFCRFYQVGWHNLPGFGLGGLVYSARQVATAVLKKELKR